MNLTGKRALVTGGTKGMGAAIADALRADGAAVAVAARHDDGNAAAPLIQADLATVDGAESAGRRTVEMLGGVDIVVHCVGASFGKPGGMLALDDEEWLRALSTNFLSAVRLDRTVLPGMVAQRSGTIVHIASLQWKRPHESSPA